ncbi:MAG: molybdopterin-synthase adenylyltransferase MoeB [Rhodothermaceae bacterium]|nr:molybdopterin-synthase adenylyltransferase MoeB [Rhodothermaceae bacterium]MYC04661.1 molybdopterin-synthase adenylyltransferase MoeB [Rhodothermaceae bacterium]MYI17472.1 molybdopterin-synthase adenylyltransferase MoeB [Rhodothermaceae bacterium]
MLNQAEHLRYSRQISLSELGVSGQQKLKESSVAIVGAGGLGSPLAFYLTAAGVGHLGIIDFDIVDASNLHRQILHTDEFIGIAKLESALVALEARNPYVKITRHDVRLQRDNAMEILGNYDVVADCSDNFATRYLINDASVLLGIPNVYGSVYQFEGQITVFGDVNGPCYRCLHPALPPAGLIPTCAESGVLGVLPGVIGSLQASEVLKLLLGFGQPLIGRMALVDLLTSEWQTLKIQKDEACPICSESPTICTLVDYGDVCISEASINVTRLNMLRSQDIPIFLLDVRQAHEAAVLSMGANQQLSVDELPDRLHELSARLDDRIVVHCQTGVRSKHAVQILQNAGYLRAVSLEGGIIAWMDKYGP